MNPTISKEVEDAKKLSEELQNEINTIKRELENMGVKNIMENQQSALLVMNLSKATLKYYLQMNKIKFPDGFYDAEMLNARIKGLKGFINDYQEEVESLGARLKKIEKTAPTKMNERQELEQRLKSNAELGASAVKELYSQLNIKGVDTRLYFRIIHESIAKLLQLKEALSKARQAGLKRICEYQTSAGDCKVRRLSDEVAFSREGAPSPELREGAPSPELKQDTLVARMEPELESEADLKNSDPNEKETDSAAPRLKRAPLPVGLGEEEAPSIPVPVPDPAPAQGSIPAPRRGGPKKALEKVEAEAEIQVESGVEAEAEIEADHPSHNHLPLQTSPRKRSRKHQASRRSGESC